MKDLYWYLIFIPLSYIIGSINFATIIASIKNKDIKKLGSGNPGTMNMLRSVGKFWGCLTFVLDCAKGIAFGLIGMFVFLNSNLAMYVLGIFTTLGHIFSCFSKFKGGKGVATSLGVFAVIQPIAFAVAFVLMLLYLAFFKKGFIASLMAITILTTTCIIINCIERQPLFYVNIIILVIWTALIFWTHRSNFKRVKDNSENSLTLFGKEDYEKNAEKVVSEREEMETTNEIVTNADGNDCENN
ncbi:MAG: glycerol-3-phosphate acyltransferase [Clostridia bacterium]|nr:glycerol-3-phosphate acyltransferase [Clostridia bacterium]